jgi:hypothetical protein
MVKDLAPLIIGMDPLDNEVIWDKLYKTTFWGQGGGPIIFAGIAAIDIALWDIKGKFFNQPVYKLLGGKKRDKLRCYASQLQFGWGAEMTPCTPQLKPEEYAAMAKKAIAEGYNAVKYDFFTFTPDGNAYTTEDTARLLPPWHLAVIEERLAAVREAIGPSVDIIIENHSNTDAQSAIQIAQMAEKYNIYIVEDDYLGDLESDSKSTPIFSFDQSDRVIYIKTFSKVLLPSLRIAAVVLPKLLINTFREYKYWSDINTPLISQGALEIYINSGMFNLHINRIRNLYSQRMNDLKELVKKQASPSIRWHIPSTGGFYAGLEILNLRKQKEIVDGLLRKNIILSNIENHYLKEFRSDKFLRLSVTKVESKAIEAGILEIINEIENSTSMHKESIYL